MAERLPIPELVEENGRIHGSLRLLILLDWRDVVRQQGNRPWPGCGGNFEYLNVVYSGGHAYQSDMFVDRLNPPIRSSRYEQFRMYELFHCEDDPVLDA